MWELWRGWQVDLVPFRQSQVGLSCFPFSFGAKLSSSAAGCSLTLTTLYKHDGFILNERSAKRWIRTFSQMLNSCFQSDCSVDIAVVIWTVCFGLLIHIICLRWYFAAGYSWCLLLVWDPVVTCHHIVSHLFSQLKHFDYFRGIAKVTKKEKSWRGGRWAEREAALPESKVCRSKGFRW